MARLASSVRTLYVCTTAAAEVTSVNGRIYIYIYIVAGLVDGEKFRPVYSLYLTTLLEESSSIMDWLFSY